MFSTKRLILITILIFSLTLFLGCSSSTNDSVTNDASNSTTNSDIQEPIPFQPLTAIKEDQPNIYLIVKVIDSNYWQRILHGARDAGNELGCNIYYSGTEIETQWEIQHELLNMAVSEGADAIILGPDDSTKLAPDIEEIHNKGIPVFLVDTIVNSSSYDVCYMTDNLQAGHQSAEEMISQLYNTGYKDTDEISVAIVVGTATSQTISERISGFYQYWTSNAPANWTIIPEISICQANSDLAYEMTNDVLANYSSVAGIFSTNNTPTKGVCLAINDANRTDIAIVGFDYSDEIASLINSNEYHVSTMLQQEYNMSYLSVETAVKLLNGEEPELKYVDTGIIAVNYDCIDSPEIQALLNK